MQICKIFDSDWEGKLGIFKNMCKNRYCLQRCNRSFILGSIETTWNQVVSRRLNKSTEREKHLRFPLSGHERNSLLALPPEEKAFIATLFAKRAAIYTEYKPHNSTYNKIIYSFYFTQILI